MVPKSSDNDVDLQELIAENKALKEELTAKRAEQQQTYVPKPLDLSEYKTRKIYIDSMLLDAGWTEGKDWMNEVELPGMPNKSEIGFADYVLYDDMHRPLAIIEAKRTCVDVAKGRQQAKLYADLLEVQYKRRPVVFLTNGFETRIIDNQYPERKVSVIYSKRDLEKLFNLQTMKTSLKHISVDKNIAGRYYQEGAIKAVCDAFDNRNRRKALLVMATGSGKTRTVIALCKVLLDAGYGRHRSDLFRKVEGIASVANIPEIQAQSELINKILHTDYVDNAGMDEFEHIRVSLRNLMKYLPKGIIKYDTDFTDEILSTEWNDSELENDELKNYKAKAEFYVRQHQDNIAIAKLKTNQPLTEMDIESLEQILWKEVGSKDDYEKEYGHKPLGEFVREIVGLDMNAAKEAFSEFLNDANLDSRQIYFVNQIVEYIVHNGMMKDLSVLQESPFTDKGSVVEIFTDLTVWMGIKKVIDQINANAVA